MKRLILLLCLWLAPAYAVTVAITHDVDHPYLDASGRAVTGTIDISWKSFATGSGTNVAAGSTRVTIDPSTPGVFTVSLTANDTADPPTFYTVTFNSARATFTQQWVVGAVAGPLMVNDVVRSSMSPITIVPSQISKVGAHAGDIIYYHPTNGWTWLVHGTNGQSLTVDTSFAGYLKWATVSGGGGGTDQTDLAAALTAKIGLASLSATSPIVYNNSTGAFTHAASAATIIDCGDTTHSCRLSFDASGHVSAIANDAIASGGSGTVTVVSSGALTSTALVTGGGSATLQTPSSTATMDGSGNLVTPGSITTGLGGTAAGYVDIGQGTAPSTGTTSVRQYADTSVTAYKFRWPAAAATGFFLGTNTTNDVVGSFVGFSGAGNVARVTSPTFVTPALGTPSAIVLTSGTGLPLSTGVSGILPIANGGTGTNSPGIVQGTNVTVSGSWPNQTVSASGGGSSVPSYATGYKEVSATTSGATACTLSLPGGTLLAGGASGSHGVTILFSGKNMGPDNVQWSLRFGTETLALYGSPIGGAGTVYGHFMLSNHDGLTNGQSTTLYTAEPGIVSNFNAVNTERAWLTSQDTTATKAISLILTTDSGVDTVRIYGCKFQL